MATQTSEREEAREEMRLDGAAGYSGRREWKTYEGAPTKWTVPTIRPLFRLGELTTPTTFSASSPDRHGSDISEMREYSNATKV